MKIFKILSLLKLQYILTALIVLAGWQGYRMAHKTQTGLKGIFSTGQKQAAAKAPAQAQSSETVSQATRPSTGIRSLPVYVWIIPWAAVYTVLCLATTPLVRNVLSKESNLANALMLAGYCAAGAALSVIYTGKILNTETVITWIISVLLSAGIFGQVAGRLEQMRVMDGFMK